MKAENTTKIQFDSLSVNEAYARGAAAAFLARYSPQGKLLSVSAVGDGGPTVLLSLPAQELTQGRIRCFVLPTDWLD